ncbi:MAG: LacI family transcriptional regulator [Chloroflexi bacterium]|nr:LacI family transcriptional regulator [Chloroflexota bacterium]
MSVTILDVARRAGVGIGTVSRVLNGGYHVRPATREKVETAIHDLGYHPNTHARNLKRHTVTTVGFFFNSGHRRLSDPFFSTLMAGMNDAASDHSYDLLVASCRQSAAELAALERLTQSNRVSGVILTDTRVDDPRIALLQQLAFPFVVFGRINGHAKAPSVDVDGKCGIEQAMAHLFERGHRRIGFIGLPHELTCAQDRLAGYYAAHTSAGYAIDERYVVPGGVTEAEGVHAASQLLQLPNRPTAIVACSDVIAFGVMQVIQQAGLQVGKDISVVGFDDIPMAAYTHPPLTTVRQPIYDIGVQLVNMLIEHTANRNTNAVSRLIEPELVIRESVGFYS